MPRVAGQQWRGEAVGSSVALKPAPRREDRADYTRGFCENWLVVNKFIVRRWRKRLRLEVLRLFPEKWKYFGLCVGAWWSLIGWGALAEGRSTCPADYSNSLMA